MDEKIKVLIVKPFQDPYVAEIYNKWEALIMLVGGTIDIVPTDDGRCDIVINDEGKLIGLPVNRWRCFKGMPYDVFVGTMVIVGRDNYGNSISLTDDEIKRYQDYYSYENFCSIYSKFLSDEADAVVVWSTGHEEGEDE